MDRFIAYGFEVVQKKTGINKTSDLFSSREHIPVSPAIHANVEMESSIMKSNDPEDLMDRFKYDPKKM